MNNQTKIKGYLLLFMIASSLYISLVGQGYTATKVAAPNPAKEYPQDNLMVIDMNNLPGTQIKSMGKEELQQFLEDQGFRRLNNKSLVDLRRIWLGFMYEDFFYTMHKKTDLPISVIYAFFIIEATNNGIESRLMEKALNPGGIKYRGTGKKINAMDDCYKNGKKDSLRLPGIHLLQCHGARLGRCIKLAKVQELQKVYVSKVQQRHECKADSRCYL
jgi:hypothetical protein